MGRMTWICCVVALLLCAAECRQLSSGILYDYVHRPDPAYEWYLDHQFENNGVTTYLLRLTSLQWHTEELVDWTVWKHWIEVSVPHTIRFPDASFLNVASGNNDHQPPDINHSPFIANMARNMGIVAGEVISVPNQPISFMGGPGLTEDDLIATTWNRFMDNTTNPEELVRLPMVKASVRAMDAMAEFIEELNGNVLTRFMTSGDSKRGWIAWLLPSVDSRVIATAPSVLSMVNFHENLDQHYRSLGGWTFAFWPYWSRGITDRFNDPEFELLGLIEDPYVYRDLLTIPKLIIKATSDEFFLADDTRTYFPGLLDPLYLWLVENDNHDIDEDIKWPNIESFYLTLLMETTMPDFSWTLEEGVNTSKIIMQNDNPANPPIRVSSWWAQSVATKRRDWRMEAGTYPRPTDVEWFEEPVVDLGNGQFSAEFAAPVEGYVEFMIKAVFEGPEEGREVIMTTEAAVVPNTYPYNGCGEDLCSGIIV